MRKILLLGTLHGGLTPKDELRSILESVAPDQLFVELTPNEIINGSPFRDEMMFAYQWGQDRRITVNRFDRNTGELKEGVTGKEPEFITLSNELKSALEKYSWQELNKTEISQQPQILEIEKRIHDKFIDSTKEKEREEEMLKNIQDQILPAGEVLIITGTGHLDFFLRNLSDARLALA